MGHSCSRGSARDFQLEDQVAARAGLQANDVIVSFNGKDIQGADDFLQELVVHQPGNQIRLGIIRGGQSQSVTVTLGEAPVQRS